LSSRVYQTPAGLKGSPSNEMLHERVRELHYSGKASFKLFAILIVDFDESQINDSLFC
jgi:hypothetical protein